MSHPIVQALLAELDDDALDQLAVRLVSRLQLTAPPAEAPMLMTTAQVAQRVGCHPRTVARAIAARQLQASKTAGRWRVTPAAVDAWLATGHDDEAPRRAAGRPRRNRHPTLKDAIA